MKQKTHPGVIAGAALGFACSLFLLPLWRAIGVTEPGIAVLSMAFCVFLGVIIGDR